MNERRFDRSLRQRDIDRRPIIQKEDVLDHIKRLYLPYTMIDVGWWFQLAVPPVPSGKLDAGIVWPFFMTGTVDVPLALTDLTDVGRFAARIITDPRTLNKLVFAYDEVSTLNQIWDVVEKETGESISRKSVSVRPASSDHPVSLTPLIAENGRGTPGAGSRSQRSSREGSD